MAKKRGRKSQSTSGYFRKIFIERPEWLHQKSNNDVLARYRADHGLSDDADVEPRIKNNLANLKSLLRKDVRSGTGGTATAVAPRAPRGAGALAQRLETLEELIDECLSTAKSLDAEGLHGVIRNLRSARNEVVWKLGQP